MLSYFLLPLTLFTTVLYLPYLYKPFPPSSEMTSLTEIPRVWEPAQAELALAMAIVKHKPSGTTVKGKWPSLRSL